MINHKKAKINLIDKIINTRKVVNCDDIQLLKQIKADYQSFSDNPFSDNLKKYQDALKKEHKTNNKVMG